MVQLNTTDSLEWNRKRFFDGFTRLFTGNIFSNIKMQPKAVVGNLLNQHQNHFNQLYRKVLLKGNDFFFAHNRFFNQGFRTPSIRAITFDMDGTLTVPKIDFLKMRQETGIPAPKDVLDVIHAITDEKEKQRLFDIIDSVEEEANEKLEFQPHLFELFDSLLSMKDRALNGSAIERTEEEIEEVAALTHHFAVVTRNSQRSLQFFLEKLGPKYADFFSLLLSRDFRPYKPNPDCLFHIAKELGLESPQNMIMVGDSYHDISCGKKASAFTCLYSQENDWREVHTKCVEEYEPDFICHNLSHLVDVVHFLHAPNSYPTVGADFQQ